MRCAGADRRRAVGGEVSPAHPFRRDRIAAVSRRAVGRASRRQDADRRASVAMAAIYAQVTVNDLVIARYTADAWRGRIFAVRYFLTFLASGAAVTALAFLYGRGGFGLVLGTTATIALGFVFATAAIAVLVNGVEKTRARAVAPAE